MQSLLVNLQTHVRGLDTSSRQDGCPETLLLSVQLHQRHHQRNARRHPLRAHLQYVCCHLHQSVLPCPVSAHAGSVPMTKIASPLLPHCGMPLLLDDDPFLDWLTFAIPQPPSPSPPPPVSSPPPPSPPPAVNSPPPPSPPPPSPPPVSPPPSPPRKLTLAFGAAPTLVS